MNREGLITKNYVGSLTSGALLRAETRILAPYLIKKLSVEEWRDLFQMENPLQKGSIATSIRYMNTIKRRLKHTCSKEEDFLQDLVKADQIAFSQLMLLLIVLDSPIVIDFMQNVIGDYRKRFEKSLPIGIWEEFIEERRRQVPSLNGFSDTTLTKAGTTVMRVLTEVGYLSSTRERKLLAVYPTQELYHWLRELNRQELKEVFECTL